MLDKLFCSLAGLSWILKDNMVSLLLFGEYPYPEEKDFQ